ncbi:hypothetical protein [Methylomonas koyamae]|uniref:hypothetical protein n=1 Tax=Methylomonas koyamae TaxID=702114 RepID=UPI0018D46FB1|nr:hypothetical protein [Methylomonas koyamae]
MELLSLHGVPVPSSWNGLLAACLEEGVYFLAMRQEGELWQAAIDGQTIYYSKSLGLWVEK